jgi:hypothetical protein
MGGTAAAPIWMTTCGRYGSTACAMLPMMMTVVAPIRKPQKNRTARWWFRLVMSVWVLIVFPSWR